MALDTPLEDAIEGYIHVRAKIDEVDLTFYHLPPAKACQVFKDALVSKEFRDNEGLVINGLMRAMVHHKCEGNFGKAVELCECARETALMASDSRSGLREPVSRYLLLTAAECTVELGKDDICRRR